MASSSVSARVMPTPAHLVVVGEAPQQQYMTDDSVPVIGHSQVNAGDDLGCMQLCCPSVLSCCCCLLFAPITMCTGWTQVNVRSELVLLNYGKFIGTIRTPGCIYVNPCGVTATTVSTAVQTTELPALKVIDARGNPLRVSAVINWRVEDAQRAVLDVNDYRFLLRNQSEVAMKQICSAYPYEARPGVAEENLKSETGKIRNDVIALLQSKVAQAGLRVTEYQFNEISYAPEIAAAMLVRQQAEAMLDARKVVVEGAVAIAHDAIVRLKECGITMQPTEMNRLASNLIITICSESKVTPMLNLSADTTPSAMSS